jgi:tyrosinase
MHRRNFLSSVSLSALPFIGLDIFSKEKKIYSNNPPLFIRKDVGLLSKTDPVIVSYKKAVTEMKKLPAGDGRSWTKQANIHKDLCPHHTWLFLPWHRCFLYYFEQICREMSGDPNFALPYWNWANTPKVPSTFWGADNALNDNTRVATQASVADSKQIGASTLDKILSIKSFESFASGRSNSIGQLEGTPHNYIHAGFVRGHMATLGTAGLDPLFWLHHTNLDRLWSVWNSRGNSNTSDSAWLRTEFKNNFFDKDGKPVPSISVSDVLSTGSLGYVYEDMQILAPPRLFKTDFMPAENLSGANATPQTIKTNSFVSIPLTLNDAVAAKINTIQPSIVNSENDEIIKLYIDGLEIPGKRDIYLRVFINCDYADRFVPDTDPVSVGFINFFEDAPGNMSGMKMAKKNSYSFEVTENIKRLLADDKLDPKNFNIQVLAVPYENRRDSTPLKFDAVRIEIQNRPQ